MTRTGTTKADDIEVEQHRRIRPELADVPRPGDGRSRIAGLVLLAVGLAALGAWFAWRVTHLDPHPVVLVFLAAEIAGVAVAAIVAIGLAGAGEQRTVYENELPDSHRYAVAVADIVGRTRRVDLHRDWRAAARAAPVWRPRDSADATIAAVLVEGPRRLAIAVVVSIGLLVGVSPIPAPPWWAVAAGLIGYGSLAWCQIVLGRRRLHAGDRLRWSYGAIGEIVARTDLDGHAPRRWLGAMAVAVGMSMAVALRGMSDRWTHGLPSMAYDDRVMVMIVAVSLVLGALYTIQTTPGPVPIDPVLVNRRLDEGTVRQSLLAAAVLVGIVGLLAGVLPSRSQADAHRPEAPAWVSPASGGDHA